MSESVRLVNTVFREFTKHKVVRRETFFVFDSGSGNI